MNKFLLLLFISSMSLLNKDALAQIPFGGYLSTIGPLDVYPTHLENLGLGGYRSVTDINGRNVITKERRKEGMLVYVSGDQSFYQLLGTTPATLSDNTKWVKVNIGAGSSWSLSGNFATATDFFGTTNNVPVIFKANNKEGLRISPNANGINDIGINTGSPRSSFDINTSDAMIVPLGTTAQQPATTVTGMLRFNADNDKLEYADNSKSWQNISNSNTAWSLSGNTIGSTGTNTLGTQDDFPVIFNTHGVEAFRITSNADGITQGNLNLKAPLQINDQQILSDGGDPTLNNILIGNTQAASLGSNNIFIGQNAGADAIGYGIFIGQNSGKGAVYGYNNTLVGNDTGSSGMSGTNNSFFGTQAGTVVTQGESNSFFGTNAGLQTTTGSENIFIGNGAGFANIDGSDNIGIGGGPIAPGLTNSIAIGVGTQVSQSNSMNLSLKVNGLRVGINNPAPKASLDLSANTDAVILPKGDTANERPGSIGTISAVTGMLRYNNSTNVLEYYDNTGWKDVLGSGSTWSLSGNLGAPGIFLGTTNDQNVIFKTDGVTSMQLLSNGNAKAGNLELSATLRLNGHSMLSDGGGGSALNNILVGNINGPDLTGTNNIYIGANAGAAATASSSNIFIGSNSGTNALATNNRNVFVGDFTGPNIAGANNSFFGSGAGQVAGATTLNSFFGLSAGGATTTGGSNAFVGASSGAYNKTGSNNTAIGTSAGPAAGSSGLSNTVAIGSNAFVAKSNAMVLGGLGQYAVQVGINTTSPRASLDIATTDAIIVPVGTTIQQPATTITGMLRFNTINDKLEYADKSNNWQNISNSNSAWSLNGNTAIATDFFGTSNNQPVIFKTFGIEAFRVTTPIGATPGNIDVKSALQMNSQAMLWDGNAPNRNNIFLGNTKPVNLSGQYNIFMGQNAGLASINVFDNLFIGRDAGLLNTVGSNNVLIGGQTGNKVNSTGNTFVGAQIGASNTGVTAAGLGGNSFFGSFAGLRFTDGAYNNFFGNFAGDKTTTGSNNNFFGTLAGHGNVDGSYNIGIGDNAGPGLTSLINTIAIGHNAYAMKDNSLILGGTAYPVSVGINTQSPRASLDIATTDAMIIPAGNDTNDKSAIAQVVPGMVRFNTTNNVLEYHDNSSWQNVVSGNATIIKFQSTGQGVVPLAANTDVDYDIVFPGGNVFNAATATAIASPTVLLNAGVVISFVMVSAKDTVTIRLRNTSSSALNNYFVGSKLNWNITVTQ